MAAFPIGSELVLTFAEPPAHKSPAAAAAGVAMSKYVTALGEPFVSFFEPAAMKAKLRYAGFTRVTFLSVDEARTRYFRTTSLPVPMRTGIVAAIR